MLQEHGDEIETPYDALERLNQTLLSDFGIEVGTVEESYIYRAIKERMNRHLRASVERVIGRLKEFTGMNDVRARKESTAHTHILLSAVTLATVAMTAHRTGKPSLMRFTLLFQFRLERSPGSLLRRALPRCERQQPLR